MAGKPETAEGANKGSTKGRKARKALKQKSGKGRKCDRKAKAEREFL